MFTVKSFKIISTPFKREIDRFILCRSNTSEWMEPLALCQLSFCIPGLKTPYFVKALYKMTLCRRRLEEKVDR